MTSVPKVVPGDMVFWHCVRVTRRFSMFLHTHRALFFLQDVVHSVEVEHTGTTDSAGKTGSVSLPMLQRRSSNGICHVVMYIGAAPKTPHNLAYVVKQAQTFLAGQNPPDFAELKKGTRLVGLGADVDVEGPAGRVAMGLPIEVHHSGEVGQDGTSTASPFLGRLVSK